MLVFLPLILPYVYGHNKKPPQEYTCEELYLITHP